MASNSAHIHVVKKDDITTHTVIPFSSLSPPLEEGNVLVRSTVVSLTANNLTYAQLGTLRNWWDAYTVPESLQAPYNDQSQYGVVPVWGYAEVLESKVDGLTSGQVLFGFWPSHDLPVVLRFEAATDCAGHWIEISDSRKKLMHLYNRYLLEPDITRADLLITSPEAESLAWRSIFLEAGRYISRFVFGSPPIHPLGTEPWSEADADLTQAVVISLSASGKTARVFQDSLVGERKAGDGPLGWLGVSTSLNKRLIPETTRFETKVIGYEDIPSEDTVKWIAGLKPKRVIVVDFASRGSSLATLVSSIETSLPSVTITIIGVGTESKPHKPSELAAIQQTRANLPQRVQMNMSGIRDKAIELLGAETVFDEGRRYWQGFVERGNLGGLRLDWGEGVAGTKGIEGGWQKLCEQTVAPDVGLVFRL